jgi:diguanylate cyclase (GGDEF)-like protein
MARTQQAAHALQIEALSMTDELTGLSNRRGFLTMARQQLKIYRRTKERCLLFFLDLDGLKRINDELGHAAGDDAIKQLAEALQRTMRESDLIARLGGDEFVALAAASQEKEPAEIAARIEEQLRGRYAAGSTTHPLRVSIGTSWVDPKAGAPLEDLLATADQAMYQQKRRRRELSA